MLHSFHRSDGVGSGASLVFDAAGNLYGATAEGGQFVSATFFPAQFSSWRRIKMEAGQKACCIASQGLPRSLSQKPASSSMRPEISLARPHRAVPRMAARLSNWRPIRMEAGRTVWSTSSKASPLGIRRVASSSAALALSTVRQRDCSSGCNGVVYQITP